MFNHRTAPEGGLEPQSLLGDVATPFLKASRAASDIINRSRHAVQKDRCSHISGENAPCCAWDKGPSSLGCSRWQTSATDPRLRERVDGRRGYRVVVRYCAGCSAALVEKAHRERMTGRVHGCAVLRPQKSAYTRSRSPLGRWRKLAHCIVLDVGAIVGKCSTKLGNSC